MARYFRDDATGRIFKAEDSVTPEQIEAFKASLAGGAPSDASRVGGTPAANRNADWLRTGANALPYLGGAAGGAIGGAGGLAAGLGLGSAPAAAVGGAAGAHLGGMAGEAAKQAAYTALGLQTPPPFSMDAVMAINRSGNEQAGLELGGRAMGAGAKMLGEGMVRGAYGVTRTTKDAFRGIDIPKAAIERNIPVGTIFGRGGVAEVEARAAENALKGHATLDAAEKAGHTVTVEMLAAPLLARAARRSGGPLTAQERAQVLAQVKREANTLLSQGQSGGTLPYAQDVFTPTEAATIRQVADEAAKGEFGKQGKRGFRGATSSIERFIGDGARRSLARIPGYAAIQTEQQTLMALRQAANMAVHRRLPSAAGSGIFGSMMASTAQGGTPERLAQVLGAAGLGAALGSPAVVSRMGLTLTRPAAREVAQGIPRAVRFGMNLNQPRVPEEWPEERK